MVSAPLSLPTGFLAPMQVEPVGRWFLSHWERIHCARGASIGNESVSDSESEVSDDEVEFEDDLDYLRSLDPKECKDQDHYKVLGLTDLRIKATDDQIKRAYRQKVLRHHPDKRKALGEEIREDDDYFTCITRAFENLGAPAKRRAYDSVDHTFDDDVPDFKSKDQDFYKVFGPVFERNARWSTRTPVPKLGSDAATREQVDKFYKFWYDFESWREYSYLDEEDKEKGSDREERRWIEKNNKIQRADKKKEEMRRIRKLVDNAYNADPRIGKFKDSDKEEKAAKKKAKQDAAKARRDAEDKERRDAAEKEKKEQEEKDRIEKEKREKERVEKEVAKKAVKKERKQLRALCKDQDYFAQSDKDRVRNMTDLDRLCEILSVDELVKLNRDLAAEGSSAASAAGQVFRQSVQKLNDQMEQEKLKLVERAAKGGSSSDKSDLTKTWSPDELSLLIKAVNLFPAGTTQRWDVVASFINQHTKTPEVCRSAKETLSKAKELQQGDFHLSSLKDEVNKKAYENLEKQKKRDIKVDDVEASTRTETAAEAQGINVSPWTSEEQKLLEQALKTYSSALGPERWEKIASCLPSRSKKDCMIRYKELAEMVRAKKAAQAAAAAATLKK